MSFKVLLVYPNYRGMNMLPPAMGLLSAVLKKQGVDVRLFDTTYYENLDGRTSDSDHSKTDRLMARPYEMPKQVTLRKTNCFDDFEKEVKDFNPDLIALSATEDMFKLGIKLLKRVRNLNVLSVVGGVFATFSPDLALSYPEIDIVCRGEGEESIAILCDRLAKCQDYTDIPNLWIKRNDGSLIENKLKLVDINKNPLIDLSIFEEARFYRPMGGKVYKMFPVETVRGCPYTCTYCNSPVQIEMYKKEICKPFFRIKKIDKIKEEILFYKDDMGAEYLYFWSDTFLAWPDNIFNDFVEMYKKIKLPFWCQTRIETLDYDKVKKLKDIGCARMSFGIEHGNEEFRKKILKRNITNKEIIDKLKIVDEVGITYSVNNIIGFPGETYELAFDTIELNRNINAADRNAYPFAPFHGTPLREECERLRYVKRGQLVDSFVAEGSILDMPQFTRKQVNALAKTFNMYVKFPKARWPEIKQAEPDTVEANKIYEKLKQEFVEKYF